MPVREKALKISSGSKGAFMARTPHGEDGRLFGQLRRIDGAHDIREVLAGHMKILSLRRKCRNALISLSPGSSGSLR